MSDRIETIQRHHNLNTVHAIDVAAADGASHLYEISSASDGKLMGEIMFQRGGRNAPGSNSGALDNDLLEIVRHRLKGFQGGPFACRENAVALTHIEEALLWMNKRVEDRAARGVLGTPQV